MAPSPGDVTRGPCVPSRRVLTVGFSVYVLMTSSLAGRCRWHEALSRSRDRLSLVTSADRRTNQEMTDRSGFADFIRRRREQLRPEDVGTGHTHRRCTPGLRREEVAMLAGVSVDYYARLEQGRGSTPSIGVVSGGGSCAAVRPRSARPHAAPRRPPGAAAQLRRSHASGLIAVANRLVDLPAVHRHRPRRNRLGEALWVAYFFDRLVGRAWTRQESHLGVVRRPRHSGDAPEALGIAFLRSPRQRLAGHLRPQVRRSSRKEIRPGFDCCQRRVQGALGAS